MQFGAKPTKYQSGVDANHMEPKLCSLVPSQADAEAGLAPNLHMVPD
jgi:hypothetical protein